MLRVAVLLDNTLKTDRRAVNEIHSLKALPIHVTLYCNAEDDLPAEEQQDNLLIKRIFTPDYWAYSNRYKLAEFAKRLAQENYDVLHCHDQYLLHVGALVKKQKPKTILIYESRELFHSWPVNFARQTFINRLKTYVVRYLEMRREKSNGRYIDYLITVNESIARILENYFALKNKAIVTRNVPRYKELLRKDNTLRRKYNIPDHDVVIVFIGVNVYRHTNMMENFVQAIAHRPDTHLIIITRRNERRIWFEEFVAKNHIQNIYFHDLIPVDTIEEYISCCDIGLVTSWYKKKLSYWLALDNKLFTYIMSELPLLGTAQPEFEKVILKYDVGVCINPERLENIESGIQELIKNKDRYKANCKIAKRELCWEREQQALLDLYQQLIRRNAKNL